MIWLLSDITNMKTITLNKMLAPIMLFSATESWEDHQTPRVSCITGIQSQTQFSSLSFLFLTFTF